MQVKMFYNLLLEQATTESEEYDLLMGKLLHLYGSIPVPKFKAARVIKNIINNTENQFFRLDSGKDDIINFFAPHDKVRFKDYFDSLIFSKDIRGHNFEGTVAGLYNGDISEDPSSKWDVEIEGKTWSVKFVDNASKAPELGKYSNSLGAFRGKVELAGGLTYLYKSENTLENRKLKNDVFNKVISKGITGGWIIAYPTPDFIQINVIDLQCMKQYLCEGGVVAPKGGFKDLYSLALSSHYKGVKCVKKSQIMIPKLTLEELRQLNNSTEEDEFANQIFGAYGRKIRPDVLRYIKLNSGDIGDKLLKYSEYIENQDEI